MSEGEAFVNPIAGYLAQSGSDDTHAKEDEPDRRRRAGVVARSLIEILAAIAASAIVVFTVARAGVAVGHDAGSATVASGSMTCPPDPLIGYSPDPFMICGEVNGEMICMPEST